MVNQHVIPADDPRVLDDWLAMHGWTRADLDFGDLASSRQRFIHEYGYL